MLDNVGFKGAAPARCPTNIMDRIMCLSRCTLLAELLNQSLFVRNCCLFIVFVGIRVFAEEEGLSSQVNNMAEAAEAAVLHLIIIKVGGDLEGLANSLIVLINVVIRKVANS